jgi:hypothetical protein
MAATIASASQAQAKEPAGSSRALSGPSWTKPVKVDFGKPAGLAGVSCASASFCVAVDGLGHAFVYNGSSWSKSELVDPAAVAENDVSTVSCASKSLCAVGDLKDNVVIYNGATWSKPKVADPTAGTAFFAVSCPTATFCMAVDGATTADAIEYNGTTWSKPTVVGAATDIGELTDVSCPSVSFCLAVGGDDQSVAWNGKVWKAQYVDARSNAIEHEAIISVVACASPKFCVGAGNLDNVRYLATYDGTSWSRQVDADPRTNGFASASCAAGPYCMVLDLEGSVITYRKGSWSQPERIEPPDNYWFPTAISCPTSSFCMAVDGEGFATHTGR